MTGKKGSLREIFPGTLTHTFGLVAEGIWDIEKVGPQFGASALTAIEEAVRQFASALDARGLAGEGVGSFERVDRCFAQVRQFFDEAGQGRVTDHDAEAVLRQAQDEVDRLREIADAMDEESSA